MQIEAVIAVVFLVLYFFVQAIKYLFDLLTGETKREREEVQRQQDEDRRRDEERKREEAAERQARADAKKQFEQAILNGQFPTNEVLSVLANCDEQLGRHPHERKRSLRGIVNGHVYPARNKLRRRRAPDPAARTNRGTCSAEGSQSRTTRRRSRPTAR